LYLPPHTGAILSQLHPEFHAAKNHGAATKAGSVLVDEKHLQSSGGLVATRKAVQPEAVRADRQHFLGLGLRHHLHSVVDWVQAILA
jgi:hypothetical protein